jgi:cbb3-type cytochrome oxidase maturation protein
MTIILFLLGVSLTIGAGGLGVFLWSLRSGQYDDLDGAANRILFDDDTMPSQPAKVIDRLKADHCQPAARADNGLVHPAGK